MPERETGNERFARLDREAQAYLAAMPEAERRALCAAWEAQRPLPELAVGVPPPRFINCWAAAVAARGGTEDALRILQDEMHGWFSSHRVAEVGRLRDVIRRAYAALAAARPVEDALTAKDGLQQFGCPECGNVRTLPYEAGESTPWCLHHDGNISWRAPNASTQSERAWARMVPVVVFAARPVTGTKEEPDA